MEFDEEEFRKKFPALYEEIRRKTMYIPVTGSRSGDVAEKEERTRLPGVIDYLRRCDTDEQGREVIEYLLRIGELSSDTASALLKQLENHGIRSFGTRKQLGHYFKQRP